MAIWSGPQASYENVKIYKKNYKNSITLGSYPHCPMGKVALLQVFPLSFYSSLSNIKKGFPFNN
jgi:hypothetical protein